MDEATRQELIRRAIECACERLGLETDDFGVDDAVRITELTVQQDSPAEFNVALPVITEAARAQLRGDYYLTVQLTASTNDAFELFGILFTKGMFDAAANEETQQ